eukprot:3173696-Karenia_brevis.AAC.1
MERGKPSLKSSPTTDLCQGGVGRVDEDQSASVRPTQDEGMGPQPDKGGCKYLSVAPNPDKGGISVGKGIRQAAVLEWRALRWPLPQKHLLSCKEMRQGLV